MIIDKAHITMNLIKRKGIMNKDKVSKCCGAELYDQSETGYAPNEVCSNCEKRAESILVITKDICPWGEPLHNHHDGCPSCYIADKYGYKTSEDISKGMKELIQQKKLIDDDINIPN